MNLVVECGFLPFAIEAVIWIPEAVLLRVVPFLCDGLPETTSLGYTGIPENALELLDVLRLAGATHITCFKVQCSRS